MLGCIYMIIWRLVRWDARNADWSEQEVWLSLSNNVNLAHLQMSSELCQGCFSARCFSAYIFTLLYYLASLNTTTLLPNESHYMSTN